MHKSRLVNEKSKCMPWIVSVVAQSSTGSIHSINFQKLKFTLENRKEFDFLLNSSEKLEKIVENYLFRDEN